MSERPEQTSLSQETSNALPASMQQEHVTYHDVVTSNEHDSSNGTTATTTNTQPGSPARRTSSDTLTEPSSRVQDAAVLPTSRQKPRSHSRSSVSTASSSDDAPEKGDFMPIKSAKTGSDAQRPGLSKRKSIATEEDLFRVLSQRKTAASGPEDDEERNEVEKLLSRMFGKERQAHSEEEHTRHAGVIFRELTVLGKGLGADLQATVGDIFCKSLYETRIDALIEERDIVFKPLQIY